MRDTNKKIALYVRELLRNLLKTHVKNNAEREKLAGILGQSTSNVKNMLYRGEGSLDSWVTAFSHYYGIDEKGIDKLYRAIVKMHPVTAPDKIYFELSEKLEPDRLYYFMCLIRAAADMEKDFSQKKHVVKVPRKERVKKQV
jgi:hypothetical protein